MTAPSSAQELAALSLTVRRFLAREVHAERLDEDGVLPPSLRASAAEIGLFSLTIPEAYEGMGLSLGAACSVIDEIARVDRSVAIMVGLHAGLGTRPLVAYGSEALRAQYLPSLAAGRCIAAFAATEPGAGSDLSAVRTTGRIEGNELVLTGEKAYVTNGGFAGIFTVLARTPGFGGARAHSLVCVPRSAAGLSLGAEEKKLGIKASSTVSLFLDEVRVPLANVLGIPGQGLEQAHHVLSWGRTLMAAGCVGTARSAVDATLTQVQERKQFARSLAKFSAVQAQVSSMASLHYAMDSLVRSVGERAEKEQDLTLASVAAKVFCSESAFEVCDQALQLHGAQGYLEPTGIARMLRDCRITRIFEGANDVLLLRLAIALLAENKEREVLPTVLPGLHAARERCELLREQLVVLLERTRKEHGLGVLQRQLLLQSIARVEVLRQAAKAAVMQANRSGNAVETALAEHGSMLLFRRAGQWFAEAATAMEDEARASQVSAMLFEKRLQRAHEVEARP